MMITSYLGFHALLFKCLLKKLRRQLDILLFVVSKYFVLHFNYKSVVKFQLTIAFNS